jgi:hypothetical protein
MPKLAKKVADRVNKAETQSFDAVPGGVYEVRLEEVESRTAKSSGNEYWSWALTVVADTDGDEEHAGRKLWANTSLSEKADFKMKETFEAFGYTTDSHTDDIVGEHCLALVSETVIEQGARKGQPGNNVDRLMPLEGAGDDDDEKSDEDDVF